MGELRAIARRHRKRRRSRGRFAAAIAGLGLGGTSLTYGLVTRDPIPVATSAPLLLSSIGSALDLVRRESRPPERPPTIAVASTEFYVQRLRQLYDADTIDTFDFLLGMDHVFAGGAVNPDGTLVRRDYQPNVNEKLADPELVARKRALIARALTTPCACGRCRDAQGLARVPGAPESHVLAAYPDPDEPMFPMPHMDRLDR